ncbi:MAG: hypothetical protein BJ554DRAFT_5131 [Olpidium bornovanus]|uniref:Uncharacterized protein n=1 Tax=Olpidium bornovanus TaxID=278681 RepID=A0A8H8DEP0_9FUNG|nr:MAG: hypothetical protein BJ554DRAFT_5131 [Olpidium bornovanus]
MLGCLVITSNTRSGKSFGCGDVKRIRTPGTARATRSRRSAKRRPPDFSLYTVLKPAAISEVDGAGSAELALPAGSADVSR